MLVELLDLVIVTEPVRAMAEQALLRHLMDELQCHWSRVPVVVPESNLTAQVFFRDGQYKAVRVLNAYFDDEDGYFMTDEFAFPRDEGGSTAKKLQMGPSLKSEDTGRSTSDPWHKGCNRLP